MDCFSLESYYSYRFWMVFSTLMVNQRHVFYVSITYHWTSFERTSIWKMSTLLMWKRWLHVYDIDWKTLKKLATTERKTKKKKNDEEEAFIQWGKANRSKTTWTKPDLLCWWLTTNWWLLQNHTLNAFSFHIIYFLFNFSNTIPLNDYN